MTSTLDMGRLLTAMVTPMTPEGGLDLARTEELAAYLVAGGNDGLVVNGTTGESPTLTHEEKLEVLRAVRHAVPGTPVVMGAGSNDTAASIALARDAARSGADVVMAVVPYYNKPPQRSLVAHFTAIAAAIDAPVLLYNVPSRTSANLAATTAIELSQVPNIVALKEASADLDQCAAVIAGAAPGFRVYSGDDSLTLPMLALGAHGVVSVAGHFAGPGIQRMMESFFAGDVVEAARLHARLRPIFNDIFCTTSPIPTKSLLRALGMDVGPCRLPLSFDDLADEQLAHLLSVFEDLGDLAAQLPRVAASHP